MKPMGAPFAICRFIGEVPERSEAPVLKFDYTRPALSALCRNILVFNRLDVEVMPSRRALFHPVAGRLGPNLGPRPAQLVQHDPHKPIATPHNQEN